MPKKLQFFWIPLSVIGFIIIYFKLKPNTKEEILENCNEYYARQINNKICNAYFGRASIIIELCDGENITWRCEKIKFIEYRNNLKSLYNNKDLIKPFKRIDSLYKPKESFDFNIYINSNPDSLIQLNCDYDCNQILKK